MTTSLSGSTVALAEGRQLEELAQMFEKEGATVLRYPMLNILDAPDTEPVLAWLRELVAGRFAYVVLMTGEALRRLLGFAERAGMRDAVVEAFGKARTVTRGPKPARALKEIGLMPTVTAGMPTTDGVIATLMKEPLSGVTVGVTLYGEPNEPLVRSLQSSGATVHTVMPYVYAPASDAGRVAELIQQLSAGRIHVVVFTSSPQIDRLYEVARERGLEKELHQGWSQTRVAAIGPVVAENLRSHGAPVHLCPEQGFVMKNLVQLVKREFPSV